MISSPFIPSTKLGYAETHYKFKLPWSPLFSKWPELFLDGAHYCIPGEKPMLYLVVKDADYFPVTLKSIELSVQHAGSTLVKEYPLNIKLNQQFQFLPLELPVKDTGEYLFNGKITVEKANGKKLVFLNSNLKTLTHKPLKLKMLKEALPVPPQWYAGETHCHSIYSSDPVEFGASLEVMQSSAQCLGLDYVLVSDHSYDFYYDKNRYMSPIDPQDKWREYREEVEQLNKTEAKTLLIAGEEVSCGNSQGENVHLLVMGYPDFLPGLGDGGRRWFNNKPDKSIEEVLEEIGETPSFAAHPKARIGALEKLIFRRGVWTEQDIKPAFEHSPQGLQFWNGNRNKDFSLGRAFWVSQLLQGKKVLPIAGNDAHGDLNFCRGVKTPLFSLYQNENHIFGKVKTLIKAEGKTLPHLQEGIRQGNVCCTDGPFCALSKNGSQLSLEVLSQIQLGGIKKIHLFSGTVGDSRENHEKTWELGEESTEWNEVFELKKCSYYRLEVWTHHHHLALSAPCFLEG